jgi:predicted nuclease of predicted toxin-antitoxin system
VKLLLDENLSPRLAAALCDLYPGSLRLRDCGLRGASNSEVWRFAIENKCMIVSKDSDFAQRSLLFGGLPKVVWLRIGNCTTARADFVLRNASERIVAFENSEESCLVLTHPHSG